MTEKLKERTVKYLRDAKNPKYKRSLSNILTHLNIDNLNENIPVFILELVNDNILVQHNRNVSPGSNNVAPISHIRVQHNLNVDPVYHIYTDIWLEYNPYPKSEKIYKLKKA